MVIIPLQVIPNQSLSIRLSDNYYDIRIVAIENNLNNNQVIMAFDIIINNVVIISGQRAIPGFPIIPYEYLENGNFVFITNNNEYPNYNFFGITQFLVFADETELETIRATAA